MNIQVKAFLLKAKAGVKKSFFTMSQNRVKSNGPISSLRKALSQSLLLCDLKKVSFIASRNMVNFGNK